VTPGLSFLGAILGVILSALLSHSISKGPNERALSAPGSEATALTTPLRGRPGAASSPIHHE
jgi:hypothetical protein